MVCSYFMRTAGTWRGRNFTFPEAFLLRRSTVIGKGGSKSQSRRASTTLSPWKVEEISSPHMYQPLLSPCPRSWIVQTGYTQPH